MNDISQAWIVDPGQPVLVTGANGFIGTRVVKTLLDYGFRRVRCFVRPSSNISRWADDDHGHQLAPVLGRPLFG